MSVKVFLEPSTMKAQPWAPQYLIGDLNTWVSVATVNKQETSLVPNLNRSIANDKLKSKNRGKGNEHLDASYKFSHILHIIAGKWVFAPGERRLIKALKDWI